MTCAPHDTTLAVGLTALVLTGCVIDVGVPLTIDAGGLDHDTIEVHLIAGPCPVEWTDEAGGVTRAGAIELAEGLASGRDVVARSLIRTGELDEALPRLTAGTYCITAIARTPNCITTGMAIRETSVPASSPMPILVTLAPPARTAVGPELPHTSTDWSCGQRICAAGECITPTATPDRCGDRCSLCPAFATDAAYTASHGGYGACEFVGEGPEAYVVPSIPLLAADRATPYEWTFIDVCATTCLVTGLYKDALGTTSEELAAAAAECGECCGAVGNAGLCGSLLTSYLECAVRDAILATTLAATAEEQRRVEALGRPLTDDEKCLLLVLGFFAAMRCEEGTACAGCRETLEASASSLGITTDLGMDEPVQRLAATSICGLALAPPAP